MKDFSKATPRPWEKITQSNEVIVLRKGHIELARFNPNIDEGEINAELAQIAVNNFDKMKEFVTEFNSFIDELQSDGFTQMSTSDTRYFKKKAEQLLESIK